MSSDQIEQDENQAEKQFITTADLLEALRDPSKLNFSDKNLSKVDFTTPETRDLSGANLSGAILTKANLQDVILDGANLSDAKLEEADLTHASLRGTKLSNARMYKAILNDANLSNVDLSSADLSEAKICRTKLYRADLSSVVPANLYKADLTDAHLSDAIISGANLSGAILIRANLSDAIMSGANLSGATLIRANLSRANLSRANLSMAILSDAKLFEVNLSQANLREADLQKADLEQAILSRADLTNAKLDNARLSREALAEVHLEITRFRSININGQGKDNEVAINEAKSAKTYLSDVQQVADAFSNRINQYNDNVLQQSQRSFNVALTLAFIGVAVFFVTIGIFIFFSFWLKGGGISANISFIGGTAGALVEVISGIIFVLYARTSGQFKTFHVSLHRTQLFLLANSICESLDRKEKQLARRDLVEIMANTSATLGEGEPKVGLNENAKKSPKHGEGEPKTRSDRNSQSAKMDRKEFAQDASDK